MAEPAYRFGPFVLSGVEGLALFDGTRLRLGGPALGLLHAFVEKRGTVIGNAELAQAAWPDRTQREDAALRMSVAALRRLLARYDSHQRYIANVPGRGYVFVGPVTALADTGSGPALHEPSYGDLPAPLGRLIGREQAISDVLAAVERQRFVSIIGTGGIGKTSLALAVGARVAEAGARPVMFVDFGSLGDAGPLALTLAASYGLQVPPSDPIGGLAAFLADRRDLIILDNCEHLVDGVVVLIEGLLRATRDVHVLATSREPLRGEGEWQYRAETLAFPSSGEDADIADLQAYPAVEMFLDRLGVLAGGEEPSDDDVRSAAGMVADLDGLPLAIEIAAAQVALVGARSPAALLDERFLAIQHSRRTAAPRQQTMEAVLDWSYALLSESEREVLARLSIFRGRFDDAGVLAIASDPSRSRGETLDLVANLAAKSLVEADISGDNVRYRLPVVTRVYARLKLDGLELVDEAQRRHAAYFRDLLVAATPSWTPETRRSWTAEYGPTIDDVRAALDWAYGPDGDAEIGVELSTAFIHLGYQLWLVQELHGRTVKALESYPFRLNPRPRLEVRLSLALGNLTQQLNGPSQLMQDMLARAFDIADQVGLPELQAGAITGAWAASYGSGDYPGAERFAMRLNMAATASNDPGGLSVAKRIMSQSQHQLGNQTRALRLADDLLGETVSSQPLHFTPFAMSHKVSMGIVKSRILWMQGKADEAHDLVLRTADSARDDMVFAVCHSHALGAIPVALWRGDNRYAAELITELVEHCRRHSITWWAMWAAHYAQVLKRRGFPEAASNPLMPTPAPAGAMVEETLGTFDPHFFSPVSLQRVELGIVGWCAPEFLRLEGLRQLQAGGDGERLFRRAMAIAADRGEWAWELRAAMSLGRLQAAQDKGDLALATVLGAYHRFTEGFETADLREARQLIAELGGAV